MTVVDWRDFKIKFMDIWHDIPTANQEGASQMIMRKMPPFISNRFIEEHERRRFKAPKVCIAPMENVTRENVSESIENMIGRRPRDVFKLNEKTFVAEFFEDAPILALLAFNGKELRDGMVLKIQRSEQK